MPPLTKQYLINNIKGFKNNDNLFRKYAYFVETGIWRGDTTFEMEKLFQKVFAIELNKNYLIDVKSRYNGNKIEFLEGKTEELIGPLCKKLDKRTVFFLDAHTDKNPPKWLGATNYVPIFEELKDIIMYFKEEAIIIVDDVKLFGINQRGWKDMSEENILKIVKPRLTNYYYGPSEKHEKDRMFIHLKKL